MFWIWLSSWTRGSLCFSASERFNLNATTPIAIAEAMGTYWTNFAKYGHPDGNGVPEWSVFSDATPNVMYFEQTPHVGPVPSLASLKVLDEYFKWRRSPEGTAWAK